MSVMTASSSVSAMKIIILRRNHNILRNNILYSDGRHFTGRGSLLINQRSGGLRCNEQKRYRHDYMNIGELTHPETMVSPKYLKMFQPRILTKNRLFKRLPPDHLNNFFLSRLGRQNIRSNPAKILSTYKNYAKRSDDIEVGFLVDAFYYLGQNFHPNSYFATADRQIVVDHMSIIFKIYKCGDNYLQLVY